VLQRYRGGLYSNRGTTTVHSSSFVRVPHTIITIYHCRKQNTMYQYQT